MNPIIVGTVLSLIFFCLALPIGGCFLYRVSKYRLLMASRQPELMYSLTGGVPKVSKYRRESRNANFHLSMQEVVYLCSRSYADLEDRELVTVCEKLRKVMIVTIVYILLTGAYMLAFKILV